MQLRRNIPSRNRPSGNTLSSNLMMELTGEGSTPSNQDIFDPLLERVRTNIQKKKCRKCKSNTKMIYGRFGRIKLICMDDFNRNFDSTNFVCSWCTAVYASYQNFTLHWNRIHSNERICPFCQIQLPSNSGDQAVHVSKHLSKRIERQANEEVEEGSQNMPNQNVEFPPSHAQQVTLQNRSPHQSTNRHQQEVEQHDDPDDSGDHIVEHDLDDSPGDHVGESQQGSVSYNFDQSQECIDEDDEIYDKRKFLHLKSLYSEFSFTRTNSDGFEGKVIIPLKPHPPGFCDVFFNAHNLELAKYARKANLSEELVDELVNLIIGVFESPLLFYSAESLFQKIHKIGGSNGFKCVYGQCGKGHKICYIPIEEGLKILLSKDSFLMNFHVQEWPIGENEPYIHFRQSEKFINEARRVRTEHNAHYISIIANRDSFPGLLTSIYPIKGFYYSVGNLDFPESKRHVMLFAFGLECKLCMKMVEEKFVENVNGLSMSNFLFYHRYLQKFVVSRIEFDAEVDDCPQVCENKMTKGITGRNFCFECGEHSDNYTNVQHYHKCKSKSLLETERLYNRAEQIMRNGVPGDGSITRISELEDKTGRTFTEYIYDERRGTNKTVLKNPTSFFRLNRYTKTNLVNPPGPFHVILKGFVLHTKDGLAEQMTPIQKRQAQSRWIEIIFPEEVKKPKNMWEVGGNNFDGISALVYGLPLAVTTVVPARLSSNLRRCFSCISTLLNSGYSKKQLEEKKRIFRESVPIIAEYILLQYPTSHLAFHVWDRVIPPTLDYDQEEQEGEGEEQPKPPNGPILGAFGTIVGLGHTVNWDEKKFEMFHKRFKKKMRKCNLKNPSMFLVKDFIADEHMSVLYPEEKYVWFSSSVKFIPFKQGFLPMNTRVEMISYLGLGGYIKIIDEVEFVRIKKLVIKTKPYKEGYKVIFSNFNGIESGIINHMTFVSWNDGTPFEESEIVIVSSLMDNSMNSEFRKRKRIHRIGAVIGKPFVKDGKVVGLVG